MNKETAELLVRTVRQHYGEHPNTAAVVEQIRIRHMAGEWMVVTPFATYYRIPFRMPLHAHPCRCVARWCASGKVAPGLLDTIRPEDPRADLCIGEANTCPRGAVYFTVEYGQGRYGFCAFHQAVKTTPARI